MKMVKKILLGIVTAAAVLSLAGCGLRKKGGNESMIKVPLGSSKATVDETNESTSDVSRGFKTLQTKHTDAICKITNTINGTSCDGVMGYIFDYKEETDKSVSFTIAGLRIKTDSDGKHFASAYVETYKNVDPETLETGSGFMKLNGAKADPISASYDYGWGPADGNFGKILVRSSDVELALAANKVAGRENELDIWVELVANLGSGTTGRDGTQGTYTVNFYHTDPKRTKGDNNTLTYTNKTGCLLASANVSTTNTAFTTELPQTEQGFYATVYGGQTLTGKWEFSAIKKEAEEIEE